jgi:hypothetical protein
LSTTNDFIISRKGIKVGPEGAEVQVANESGWIPGTITDPVAHIADASTAHALNATFSDTEAEAALNALGTTINAILAALETHGIVASE